MATAFQPPPTYALPIVVDEKSGRAQFSPIWLKWFVDMAQVLSSFGGGSGAADHNLLSGLQGGGSSQYYHLTSADQAYVSSFKPIAVGGLYLSTDSTNPATTLGYGTWEAYASGSILVGV